jgi:conjugative relaxase-like TrwC/TraI family protein
MLTAVDGAHRTGVARLMFTMAKIRDGSTYLSQHLSANDYYAENESVVGHWQGRAAERLGLTGEISSRDTAFEALRCNRHPHAGQKLTARDGEERIRFYDFQCSAPKSVSIMAVTLGDARLLLAHEQAVSTAFAELEKFAATQANTQLVRQNRVTGNVVAAAFTHTASRALDPQVHTHLVTANATWDEASQSWRALTEFEMLRAIRYAGKVYQNELAKSCRALGYDLVETRDAKDRVTGFEVRGVSPEVWARFSKRRVEVEAGIAAFRKTHGRAPTTTEIHAITVASRDAKLREITTLAVLAAQQAQLSPGEWTQLTALRQDAEHRSLAEKSVRQMPLPRERESVRLAVGHVFERRSVAEGQEILAEALNQNLGHIDLSRLHTEAKSSGLVALTGQDWLCERFATARGLQQEKWAVAFVERTREQFAPLGAAENLGCSKLSSEQTRALAELLRSRDQVLCLRGAAGVGKTTVIQTLHATLARDARAIFYCAPTTSAADTLRKDGLPGATTVSDFLQNVAVRERTRLTEAVVVVDEAGLASNTQGAELLKIAERHRTRVVFIGDSKQHTSVEAGDFLRVLERHSPLRTVELLDIRRQSEPTYRHAVTLMATGCSRGGLETLDTLGWIKEGHGDYLHQAVATFLEKSQNGTTLESVIAVTPTWVENHTFTEKLRAELKHHGVLAQGEIVAVQEPLPWTRAQTQRPQNYEPGMVVTVQRAGAGFQRGQVLTVARVEEGKVWVSTERGEWSLPLKKIEVEVARVRPLEVCPGDKLLVRANDRSAQLLNGEIVTVQSVKSGQIALADGRMIDTEKFAHLTQGFAVTSHKSQSKTADHVVVAAEKLDAKSAYVACSRGRLSCTIHTPDKANLLARLPSGERTAAIEVLSGRAMQIENRTGALRELLAKTDWRERINRAASWEWWQNQVRQMARWITGPQRTAAVDERAVSNPPRA